MYLFSDEEDDGNEGDEGFDEDKLSDDDTFLYGT